MAGELCEDPRLNPLRLDGVLELRTLHIHGPTGSPPERVTVSRRRTDGTTQATNYAAGDEGYIIPVFEGNEVKSYGVHAKGCMLQEFLDLHDGMVIELTQGVPVVFQQVGDPLKGAVIIATLTPKGTLYQGRYEASSVEFDTDGKAEFLAPAAGEYLMEFQMLGRNNELQIYQAGSAVTVTIPKEGGTVEFQPPSAE